MNFVIVSHHTPSTPLARFWSDGTLGAVPEPLRLVLNCTQAEFAPSVVHTHVTHVLRETPDVVEFAANVVVRHDTVTRVLRTTTSVIKLPEVHACVTLVTQVVDAHTDGSDAFLDHLVCLVRGNLVPWRLVRKDDVDHVAVRNADAPERTETTRRELEARRCRANYNVSYTDEMGSVSHRSVLVPSCLVDTTPMPCRPGDVFLVVRLQPYPAVVRGDAAGVDDAAALVLSDTVDLGGVVHTVAIVHTRSHVLVRLRPS